MTTSVDIADLLRAARIVPVLTIQDVATAVPLASALVAGGVRTLEVTLRTPVGAKAAEAIMAAVPGAIVGLGTVLTRRDLELAEAIGATFAFSPGATPDLLDAAAEAAILFVPGIATASELMAAMTRGFTTVKLFPAAQLGGTEALKALGGPFPEARFCPTGGISEKKALDYLALPNVVAVGGSWLAPSAEVAAGNWTAIEARARRAMSGTSP
ncbi:bifunctional 4-hydroxy-2-oxoglutarate aldolase/2-dehydro-3-deoxy-phosphogluconate aldolase [Roseomonas xinghualingensis]|uniref:bifunctional 4-hydroxy-2-oxoglutarate aldolase/2-dehydro-3-deoxy-phosphogluconate aldolase n=1 Tax=Roseomonas xinghualingensis TaxID=2986475 RepID=UPI0021F24CA5|nr:bifunctional 4-hydroxy-2-oxoglutarate aldolase/2-dehydro-3-deoxy-phosphogluconate aldolase [Roseomonas sp. SXEYE001]MCV4209393.1 bifunctional 4-hydroxy-2-oxoglutarate aldolase/2-dehydro-3-deoxy-phosphogluconate aldolase [Roseomonas sp. SXEYE001]